MEFLYDYGLFLAKVATVVVIPLVALAAFGIIILRARASHTDHLEVKHLNQKFESMGLALKSAMLPKKLFKQTLKELKVRRKREEKSKASKDQIKKVFVLDFKGDIRASAVSSLREEITAVLMVATPQDEVVVRLESPGGIVHCYGLAASQLKRIKDKNIPLTVAVDRVAASGGYMMACVADRIIAAPFAVVGSIGVIGQLPNFNRFLKNHEIDFEQHAAGEYKRTLTVFGENTEKGREKFREDIEKTHVLFKEFVKANRASLDIKQVATGDYWYGLRALELKLVDELRTSDDYLRHASGTADLYEINYVRKKPVLERLFSSGIRLLQDRREFFH